VKILRRFKKRLRERLPRTLGKVRIYLRRPPGRSDGETWQWPWVCDETGRVVRYTFVIYLDPRLREGLLCETLAHEWAHCLAGIDENDQHNAEWGIYYGKCWNILLDVFEEFGY
jgi:hypothetical protein